METVRVSKSLKEMRETVSSQARQGTLDVWIKKRKRPLPASPSTTKEKEQPRNSTVQETEVQLPPTPDEDYLLLVEQIESEHIITNNLAKKKRKVEARNAPLLLPNAEKEGQGQEKDFWDSLHVRLPSSARNVYMKRGVSTLLSKWDLIKQTLSAPISSSSDLEEAILGYNPSRKSNWQFQGLHSYLNEVCEAEEKESFFEHALPCIVERALQLQELCAEGVPLLTREAVGRTLVLSQQQIASLLANAFLCTFPQRNTGKRGKLPSINFSELYMGPGTPVKAEKLRCIIHYFERLATDGSKNGNVSFLRRSITEYPRWSHCPALLTPLAIHVNGTIEDDAPPKSLQVDFANRRIGGGVLGRGCVQEEIRFLIMPELIVSRLFCTDLENEECLVITGCERFSKYDGYSDTFTYAGDYEDKAEANEQGIRQNRIVAIDALEFHHCPASEEYKVANIDRELNKAYCGFYNDGKEGSTPSSVATGHWGCGAFGGSKQLKALLQILAASVCKRGVVFFAFGDEEFAEELHMLHSHLQDLKVTVGSLYRMVLEYAAMVREEKGAPSLTLFSFLSARSCS